MMKNALIIASLLPGLCFAGTSTIITSHGNYVINTTPTTTYVVGPSGSTAPIAIPITTNSVHTYITPTGTYMSIPLGTGTTIIQTSGCCK
jgi:hypothetical protein